MSTVRILFGGVSIIGVILVAVAAILGWAVLPGYIDDKIEEEVTLESGTETWNKWTNITMPIQLKFYIFNVSNPEDVELRGELPQLQEFGPYVYDETRIKFDLLEKGGAVFFRQNISYTFNRYESIGDETDVYNILNIACVTILHGAYTASPTLVGPLLANFLYNSQEKIIRRGVSVRELTFDGYDVSKINTFFSVPLFERFLPEEYKDGRFGLYEYKAEGSNDGYYQINAGKGSSEFFGEIIEWEHKTSLDYWHVPGEPSTHCDLIRGGDGSIFPPFMDKDTVLRVFVTDLCRSVYLTYKDEMKIWDIKGYQFAIPPAMLEDPRTNIDNMCYCLKSNISECEYSGVLDVASCRGGAPIVMSTPHFLGGSDVYQSDSGLIPNEELHSTIMVVEPNSGVLLRARKRIQINFRLSAYPNTEFAHLKNMVFPVMWVDESVDISSDSAEDLKDKLLKPIKQVNIARWTVLGIGIFLAVAGAVLFFVKK